MGMQNYLKQNIRTWNLAKLEKLLWWKRLEYLSSDKLLNTYFVCEQLE